MAEKIRVKCPSCKSTLAITNAPGISAKKITCPVCGLYVNVATCIRTIIQKHVADEGESTEVAYDVMYDEVGSLYVGNTEYALQLGRNTIGRFAKKTGVAEVQLKNADDTVDKYMSRNHAIITIKDFGGRLEHRLESAGPKNIIKINGQMVIDNDVVALQWGDELTFGQTTVLFQRPGYYGEQQ